MIRSCIFLTLLVLLGFVADAATITKTKGNRALISLDGTVAHKDDQFYGLDASGKRKSVIQITNVKGNQAVALILKGKAEVGQTLSVYKASPAAVKQDAEMPEVPKSSLSNYGLLASYLINKMSAKFTLNGVEKTAEMSGNGFGILGTYDFQAGTQTQIRLMAGVEQFQVAESKLTPDCDKGTSTTCNAIITFFSTYGLLKYNFLEGHTRAWFGGGGGYLMALSKASTVLDSSQISANFVATIAGGMEVPMGRGQYLPIVLEYSFFPSSNTVAASYTAVRIGWGWR